MFAMDWFRVDRQSAFVTGAGSGIGQGIAIGLAQAGANVACFDLATSSGLDETVHLAADTPMARIASVDDRGGPAVFLASGAAAFCTGVNLLVDGGFVCW